VLTNHIPTRSVLLLAPSHVVPTERGLFTIASLDHTAPTVDYVNALVQVIRPGIGVNNLVGTSFSQVNHLPILAANATTAAGPRSSHAPAADVPLPHGVHRPTVRCFVELCFSMKQ
jgi:hypothetical protein